MKNILKKIATVMSIATLVTIGASAAAMAEKKPFDMTDTGAYQIVDRWFSDEEANENRFGGR